MMADHKLQKESYIYVVQKNLLVCNGGWHNVNSNVAV